MHRYTIVGLFGLSLIAACSADTTPEPGSKTSTTTQKPIPPAAPGVETAPLARTEDAETKASPTPGEVTLDGEWTTAEAMALDGMRSVHRALTEPGTAFQLMRSVSRTHEGLQKTLQTGAIETSDGYCYQAWTVATNSPRPFSMEGNRSTNTAEARLCVYAWPADSRNQRTFCASFDGVLMTDGTRYRGGNAPQGTAAFAAADPLPFASTHPRAGTGNDGNQWRNAPDQERLPTVALKVTTADGEPLPRFPVVVVPDTWLRRADFDGMNRHVVRINRDLPVGQFESDRQGIASLQGIPTGEVIVVTPAEGKDVTVIDDQSGITLVVHRHAALMAARQSANESAAIATLKNLSSAQAQCQASGVIDTNNNGAGEYGFFAELAGATDLRIDAYSNTDGSRMSPPVLSGTFAKVENSRVTRSGYVFQIFLPGPREQYVTESKDGGSKGVFVHPEFSEVLWCAYAWPAEYGASGKRAFFVNQGGDVLAADNKGGRYNGARGPTPYAALAEPKVDADVAANAPGTDGQTWKVIN